MTKGSQMENMSTSEASFSKGSNTPVALTEIFQIIFKSKYRQFSFYFVSFILKTCEEAGINGATKQP